MDIERHPQNSSAPTGSASLPDVSAHPQVEGAAILDQVGMSRIQTPLKIRRGEEILNIPSFVDLFVSLDHAEAKGIHMSRLYGLLGAWTNQAESALQPESVQEFLNHCIQSQHGLSRTAYLRIDLQMPLQRRALVSGLPGWRQYPFSWEFEKSPEGLCAKVEFEVLYSSTCPASTAMAEQALAEQLKTNPGLASFPAIPHAQRSRAKVILSLSDLRKVFAIEEMINGAENVLATPVQTAVKRVDELEFAKLNAQNRMFCEDAARRLKSWLENSIRPADYWLEVRHEESLHPHDAVARAVKGIPNGFRVGMGSF